MVDLRTARSLAQSFLATLPRFDVDDRPTIQDTETQEHVWGWVFFWNSRRYLETGDHEYQLGGNAPLIVRRNDGAVLLTGTALPIESYIRQFQQEENLPETTS